MRGTGYNIYKYVTIRIPILIQTSLWSSTSIALDSLFYIEYERAGNTMSMLKFLGSSEYGYTRSPHNIFYGERNVLFAIATRRCSNPSYLRLSRDQKYKIVVFFVDSFADTARASQNAIFCLYVMIYIMYKVSCYMLRFQVHLFSLPEKCGLNFSWYVIT